MPSSMLTFRYRIKDATSGKHLQRIAWAVNYVWNYCNEVSLLAWRREKRFLSAFDWMEHSRQAALRKTPVGIGTSISSARLKSQAFRWAPQRSGLTWG